MKPTAFAIVLAALAFAVTCHAADNPKLEQLFKEDQSDRQPGANKIDWSIVGPRDAAREKAVREIIKDGGLSSANDYYHAAMVFQHAAAAEDIALAYSLATIASRIDPAQTRAAWLAAAAWDRLLMRKKKPQWYGTQYVKNPATGKWELYQIDENAVSDEERKLSGVPPLAAAKERVTQMNRD